MAGKKNKWWPQYPQSFEYDFGRDDENCESASILILLSAKNWMRFVAKFDQESFSKRTYDSICGTFIAFQTHWYNNKTDIENSHENAHRSGHFPFTNYNGQEDKNQHEE